MKRLQGLTWEQSKSKGAVATNNEKLAGALVNWYFEHVNDYRHFEEMILDESHVQSLEVLGCVEEFSADIEKIITLIHIDGGLVLKRDLRT